MQYYTDNHTGGHIDSKGGGVETRNFFLNCLCLLLGRLDSKKFESTTVEYGMQISDVLLPQVVMLEVMKKQITVILNKSHIQVYGSCKLRLYSLLNLYTYYFIECLRGHCLKQ
jgi:hypothetical protein